MRSGFDRDLRRLEEDLMALGSRTEQVIVDAVNALRKRDFDDSRRIIAEDLIINETQRRIEIEALRLLATQQPMARDLRAIATALYIVNELERICDYGKSIAKLNLWIGEEELLEPLRLIPRMATLAGEMLHSALRAYAQRDLELARSIPDGDDEVDGLYDRVINTLLEYAVTRPEQRKQVHHLLSVAYHLERTADRVTNICERVVYMCTGEIVELDPDEA